jgi:hypothetical protein
MDEFRAKTRRVPGPAHRALTSEPHRIGFGAHLKVADQVAAAMLRVAGRKIAAPTLRHVGVRQDDDQQKLPKPMRTD